MSIRRAVEDGHDVDELAPAPEAEPGALLRPATEARGEHAEVAQQVAQVDQAGRRDRDRETAERADDQDRDGGQDADRDGRVGRGPERRVDAAPQATERQVPVAAHREHHPGRGALDGQRADEDRREDHEQVDLADGDPGDDLGGQRRLDGRGDREPEGLTLGDGRRHVRDGQDDRDQEDRSHETGDRHRPEHAARRMTGGVDRLLAERARPCRSRRRRRAP